VGQYAWRRRSGILDLWAGFEFLPGAVFADLRIRFVDALSCSSRLLFWYNPGVVA
jgi:hypothetical protein